MEQIDQIRINFDEGQVALLNVLLGFIMFGVALDLRVSDFRDVLVRPRLPLTGLLSEYVVLPLITLALIWLFEPAPSLALGMVLLSVCPGGNVSNFMVHLAGANAALSVFLTTVTTLGSIVVLPLAFAFWARWAPGAAELLREVYVEPASVMWAIVQLVGIPVAVGMWVQRRWPAFADRIRKPVSRLSLLIFLGFVLGAIAGNLAEIRDYLHIVFYLVLLHNGLALLGGYFTGKLSGLDEPECRTISIETGIQNSGLGLALVFNFFQGLGGMALILAWWGIWHLISGFALAWWWRRSALQSVRAVKSA